MGEVYKARDTRLTRTVAIKVLPADTSTDASARARFEREARAIAALSHPHICVVHDVGHQDGIDYLVMELLEGETLAERLARAKGPLPLDELLTIGIAIADALDKAHRAGIVHRDLKPLNVMLTKSGPKLLDFGLAKALERAGGAGGPGRPGGTTGVYRPDLPGAPDPSTLVSPAMLTGAGTILGTIHYMSPEQVEGRDADTRSDIWALGALLYEMATGQRPFDGESAASVIGAILKDTPPALSTRRPLTPPGFERLVGKCLSKDPDERWQSAKDLCDELKWVGSVPDSHGGSGVASTHTTSAPGVRVWGVVAAVAVLALVVTVWLAFRGEGQVLRPVSPETRLEISTPPTEEPASFALSPDGLRVVFVASGDGVTRLWLRPLATTMAQPLAGTDGALDPFWSPDGRSIGFFANGQLKRIDLDGGGPKSLAAVTGARGGAWSSKGVIVFAPSQNSPLLRVPAGGGEAVPVTSLSEGQQSHRWPNLLPDGHRFVFYVRGASESAGIWLGDLGGAAPRHLSPADGAAVSLPSGWLTWVRGNALVAQKLDADGAVLEGTIRTLAQDVLRDDSNRSLASAADTGSIAYRTGPGGQRQLTWFDRSGETLGTMGSPDPTYRYASLSSDGRRVAVSRITQGNYDIWLMDATRSSRFTFDQGVDEFPIWSPDDTRIVFRSLRSGHYDMWEKLVGGGAGETRLAPTDQQKTPLSWTRDGRFLLFQNVTDPVTSVDLWVLPMSAGRTPWAFLETRFTERGGVFSPDGRWVAYHSDESGQPEVYVQPFTGPDIATRSDSNAQPTRVRGQWQISNGGGIYPVWRRDGKELYYINPAGVLMAVQMTIAGSSLETGAPVALFPTRIFGGGVENRQGRSYDVAPDGRFLINTVVPSAAAPITLLQNWNPAAEN